MESNRVERAIKTETGTTTGEVVDREKEREGEGKRERERERMKEREGEGRDRNNVRLNSYIACGNICKAVSN